MRSNNSLLEIFFENCDLCAIVEPTKAIAFNTDIVQCSPHQL